MAIEAIIFDLIKALVSDAVKKQVDYIAEPFFVRRKIESKLEDSVARVVEPLIPFFNIEGIDERRQELLVDYCVRDLRPLLDKPDEFFAASLDGQKVFERRYPQGILPEAIQEEGLEHPYTLLFPRIAHLICSYPPALKAWKAEQYREDFRRLDEIARTLGEIGKKVDAIATLGAEAGDILLSRLQQTLAQRVEFQLELTALRADQPYAGKMEDLFVVPELSTRKADKKVKVGERTSSINTFVIQQRHAIVNGPPGAGKSTWLQWVQRLFLEQAESRVAILVRLRDYSGTSLPSLHDLVRRVAGTHMSEELKSDLIRSWLDAGQLAFLFDGFDEIAPPHRDAMIEWIEDLASVAAPASTLLTSRPLTTDHLDASLQTWDRWQIEPFDTPRMVEYIERWYRSAPLLKDAERQVNARALAQTWSNDPSLNHLTGNPLMLSTLLMVNHLDGELPRGRAKLYERYVNGMLGLWDKKRKVSAGSIELSSDDKRRVLAKIALHLQLNNEDQIGEGALETLTGQILEENRFDHSAVDVLRTLIERSGLLIGPGEFSFIHKSVGEFLVAQIIFHGTARDPEGRALDRLRLFEERHNDRWNTVLFFWAGLTPERDLQDFIEQCSSISGDAELLLAIGLIYDQIEKLDEGFAKSQLCKLCKQSFSVPAFEIDDQHYFPKGFNKGIELGSTFVRSLQRDHLYIAMWHLNSRLELRWLELAEADESIRPLLWLARSYQWIDLDEFQQLLNFNTPEALLGTSWLSTVCVSAAYTLASDQRESLFEPALNLLKKVLPEVDGLMPFIVIGMYVQSHIYFVDRRVRLLNTIHEHRGDLHSPEWLISTATATMAPGVDAGDVLNLFRTALEDDVSKRVYLDSHRATEIYAYIDDLRLQRDALMANLQSLESST